MFSRGDLGISQYKFDVLFKIRVYVIGHCTSIRISPLVLFPQYLNILRSERLHTASLNDNVLTFISVLTFTAVFC